MLATDVLKEEHRVIEQVLDCLDSMAVKWHRQGTLDVESAQQAIVFLRHFADGCHHHKEEKHLFPRMETRGVAKERGPIGVMLHEHDEGRQLLSYMDAAVTEWINGNRIAGDSFARAAKEYSALLRQHISKEDHCLFAMADHVLSDEDQSDLLSVFHNMEHQDEREENHEYYLNLADELTRKYSITPVAESTCGKGVCACTHA
jgi:hemerythrin-like domain-containing protein